MQLPLRPVVHGKPCAHRPEPLHPAHDLVAGRHEVARWLEVALGEVQIRPAHPARADADEQLVRARRRHRAFDPAKRRALDGPGMPHHPGEHRRRRLAHGAVIGRTRRTRLTSTLTLHYDPWARQP